MCISEINHRDETARTANMDYIMQRVSYPNQSHGTQQQKEQGEVQFVLQNKKTAAKQLA